MPKRKTPSVTVTFKEKEMWIYEIVAQHSSPSAYIKDVLIKAHESDKNKQQK